VLDLGRLLVRTRDDGALGGVSLATGSIAVGGREVCIGQLVCTDKGNHPPYLLQRDLCRKIWGLLSSIMGNITLPCCEASGHRQTLTHLKTDLPRLWELDTSPWPTLQYSGGSVQLSINQTQSISLPISE
jgi:hypothetical protein